MAIFAKSRQVAGARAGSRRARKAWPLKPSSPSPGSPIAHS